MIKRWSSAWLFLGLGCIAQASAVNLFVADFGANKVFQYVGSTGAPLNNPFIIGPSGPSGLDNPTGLTFGPDDNLYVASGSNNEVLKYNGRTGAFLGVFAGGPGNGLVRPGGLVFGPNGNLYVASSNSGSVLEYDGITGQLIQPFVTVGLSNPEGLAFGPDNNLYVASEGNDKVLKYNGTSGALLGTVMTGSTPQGCLPVSLAFAPDGSLYVGMASDCVFGPASAISKYDATTGAFLGRIDYPGGTASDLAFGPDGNLYVADSLNVLRFNGSTGTFMDKFVTGGGLVSPTNLVFGPSAPTSIPEPATYLLAGPLLALLAWLRPKHHNDRWSIYAPFHS